MIIPNKLEEIEHKILQALYAHVKDNDKIVTYDKAPFILSDILNEADLQKNAAGNALKNLEDFDFVEVEKDSIKLLPSGLKYSIGFFDHLQ
jgi:hypothetical protein